MDDRQPYAAVSGALASLAKLDYAGTADLIAKIAKTDGPAGVRGAALAALVEHDAPGAVDLMFGLFDETRSDESHGAALTALGVYKGNDPRVLQTLQAMMRRGDFNEIGQAIGIARRRHERGADPRSARLQAPLPHGCGRDRRDDQGDRGQADGLSPTMMRKEAPTPQ